MQIAWIRRNRIAFCGTSLIVVQTCLLSFAAEPSFVSRTFAEILERVSERDSESGAILTVQPKDDSPRINYGLSFSMTKVPGDEVVIQLEIALKSGDGVYERYRLRMDDAMRKELALLEKHAEVQKKRAAAAVSEATAKIEKVTRGKVRYGMTRDEVETILGKPKEVVSAQAAGSISLVYPTYRLGFWMNRLQSVHEE
jgi:hypothetical protein